MIYLEERVEEGERREGERGGWEEREGRKEGEARGEGVRRGRVKEGREGGGREGERKREEGEREGWEEREDGRHKYEEHLQAGNSLLVSIESLDTLTSLNRDDDMYTHTLRDDLTLIL